MPGFILVIGTPRRKKTMIYKEYTFKTPCGTITTLTLNNDEFKLLKDQIEVLKIEELDH